VDREEHTEQTGQTMTKHGTILLIEDDADNALLIRKAIAEAQIITPLQTVNSYDDAIQYLSGVGVYAHRESYPLPFLILLDLKTAGQDAFAMLRWLYERPGLRKRFVVVVFGAASPDQEIQLAYELGAQSYLQKPAEYKQLIETVRRVKEYWIELNLQPEQLS
jgi:CheY-like chemotaxis protein